MNTLLRAMALVAALAGISACATAPHTSASAENEYNWANFHGGCDCGPIAFTAGSAAPSWLPGQTLARYVHDKIMHCASRQFVVAASGDGDSNLTPDANLARERAAPFVHGLRSNVKYRRLDTIVLAGPHIAHPSTLAILCPTDQLPAQTFFSGLAR